MTDVLKYPAAGIRTLSMFCYMALFLPMSVSAMQLEFPANSNLASENITTLGSYDLAVSAWQNGKMQTVLTKGEVTQQAWKIAATNLTSLQIMQPLKQQLSEAGFEMLFECETVKCGGFDFRYQLDVMPEPAMHVDLGDFRFLAAQKTGAGTAEYISLLISRSQNAGYIQLTRVGEPSHIAELITSTKSPAFKVASISGLPMESALEDQGHFILEDLVFKTGSSDLGESDFPSLAKLADYLGIDPARTVTLVGHTDLEGSLAGNIALSKKRAGSVVRRLIAKYGVNKNQLSAEGNGFLSPIASNMTEEGRARNRRVEVIVTSTQ